MKRNKEARRIGREIEPYIYLVPTVVLFIFILAIPIFNLIRYSLGDSNIIQGYKGWNQFKNFKYLTSPKFFHSVKVTLIYVFFGVSGVVLFGTIMALVLDKPLKGLGIFRAIVIIPWVVPQAFAATMWRWVLNAQFGFLNQLLMALGLIEKNISFLSEPHKALVVCVVVRIWQGTPFMIMSLLSALQTVPEDIYEAAALDGVNPLQRFFSITLPHIMPVLLTTTLIVTAWTMQIFDAVNVLTGGGPARGTQLVALEIYAKAFQQDNLGTACAISLCLLVVLSLLSYAKRKIEQRGGIE